MLAMMGGQLPAGMGMGGAQQTDSMDIPKNLVGRCIGKGGAKIKELMAESGTSLSINQDVPDGMPAKMMITGSQEQIDKAKQIVSQLLEERMAAMAGGGGGAMGMGGGAAMGMGGSMGGGGGPTSELEVPIGNTLLGKIIGKGGETIRNLQNQSGVERIKLDKDAPGGPVCRIYGNEQACQVCAQMVMQIVNNDPNAANIYGANSAPKDAGKGGGQPFNGNPYQPPAMYGQPMGQPQPMMQAPALAPLPGQGGYGQQPMMAQPVMQGQPMQGQPAMMALPGQPMQGQPMMAQPMQQPGQQPMFMQQQQQPMMAQPVDMQQQQPMTAQPVQWQKVDDPASGKPYWWNPATQESSWEPPPGMQ